MLTFSHSYILAGWLTLALFADLHIPVHVHVHERTVIIRFNKIIMVWCSMLDDSCSVESCMLPLIVAAKFARSIVIIL